MSTLIDADVHIAAPPVETLYPYLSARWVEHFSQTLDNGASQHYYPKRAPNAGALEAGASLERLRADVLDDTGVEAAITSCLYAVDSVHHPDVAAALASAANDWLTREWLQPEPRLRGSVVVPIQIPALAVAEIDRVAERPGFVQVLIPARTEHPLGSRLYHPVWECIERHGLVAGVHFGDSPGVPPTPTGWPSYFLEEYAAMAGVFATQLTSLIVEGVFDSFPGLRVAFLESGFTWLPAHLWRMDKEWKNLRRLVPWVKRPPSEYVREHVRLGIQPLDAPPEPGPLLDVVDQLGSDHMLLYASDYPHLHAADPDLPPSLQVMIWTLLSERRWLPPERSAAPEADGPRVSARGGVHHDTTAPENDRRHAGVQPVPAHHRLLRPAGRVVCPLLQPLAGAARPRRDTGLSTASGTRAKAGLGEL